MESIADLNDLRPILRSLVDKGLVVELTPEGRGQVVSHALYNETRMAKLRDEYRDGGPDRPAAAPVSRAGANVLAPLRGLDFGLVELHGPLSAEAGVAPMNRATVCSGSASFSQACPIRAVLPDPDGPMTKFVFPRWISTETPRST